MEVVKAAARQGSATAERVAIRANQKSYSYTQLISSARKISSLLCNGDLKPVSSAAFPWMKNGSISLVFALVQNLGTALLEEYSTF